MENGNATEVAQPVGEEAPNAGVTENSQTPVESGDSRTAATQNESVSRTEYNKAREEHRKVLREVQRYQAEIKQLEGAKSLHDRISKDPKALQVMLDLFNGKFPQSQAASAESEKDPFEGYDPVVADALREAKKASRELEEIKRWKSDREQHELNQAKTQQERDIIDNRQNLDNEFGLKLQADGFVDKNGKPTVTDKTIRAIEKTTLTTLLEIAADPQRPTKAEMLEAYQLALEDLADFSKSNLKKTVIKNVPPSGSSRGSPAAGQVKETEAQRIARMAAEL